MADQDDENTGASNNERLLLAARTDDEDLLLSIFELPDGTYDVNCTDGLGNTPLHNAVIHASTDIIPHILSHPSCDIDPINFTSKSTPLHLLVPLYTAPEERELKEWMVNELVEAGADMEIRDKDGYTVWDIADEDTKVMLKPKPVGEKRKQVGMDDVASDDDDDGDVGTGSESE